MSERFALTASIWECLAYTIFGVGEAGIAMKVPIASPADTPAPPNNHGFILALGPLLEV
jgi:hypothetical protein